MTNMIEALKQALVLAEALTPEPGDEPNPLDILATYAKGAIAEYEARLAAVEGELAACQENHRQFRDAVEAHADNVKPRLDRIAAILEQRNGELAALREALEKVEYIYSPAPPLDDDEPGRCPWCDHFELEKHSPDCSRQLALSGQRGAQLAAVLKAVGEMVGADSGTEMREYSESDRVEVFRDMMKRQIEVVRAYRAAYPEAGA